MTSFPRDALEYQDRFRTERACWDYLGSVRWPNGATMAVGSPDGSRSTTLTEDEAWLLGALVAEGWVSKDGTSARLTCGDSELLAEGARCWERVTGGYAVKTEGSPSGFGPGTTPRLALRGASRYLRMIRPELYSRDSYKRIPIRVLNASPALQLVFLDAYNAGDGLRAGHGIDEFKSFRTTSATLACGMTWLARTVLDRRVSIYLQPGTLGGGSSYLINLNSGLTPGKKGAHLRKPQDEVRRVTRRHYEGWMCDLATESGRFAAGAGLVTIHNSPRRGLEFVTRKVTNSLARIELGLQDSISLGNLDSARDWGYAGDYVEAMWMMLQQNEPDDYVIATGETHTIRDLLDVAFRIAGHDDWEPFVQHDTRFDRPTDVDLLMGDATKAREKLGWHPRVDFETLIKMMYEHDLAEERAKARADRA